VKEINSFISFFLEKLGKKLKRICRREVAEQGPTQSRKRRAENVLARQSNFTSWRWRENVEVGKGKNTLPKNLNKKRNSSEGPAQKPKLQLTTSRGLEIEKGVPMKQEGSELAREGEIKSRGP